VIKIVFKNISRIKAALPEVLDVVMFYNNGTIFQTTYEQDINIPKLGDNLAEVLNHMRNLYGICQIPLEKYQKIIFETENVSIMILQLGEESNLALFFKGEEEESLKLGKIKRYLTKIEDLIDMDKKEFILQEILSKEENLKDLIEKSENLKNQIIETDDTKFSSDLSNLQNLISNLTEEIAVLKEKIHKK
jgi:hypothetical protein